MTTEKQELRKSVRLIAQLRVGGLISEALAERMVIQALAAEMYIRLENASREFSDKLNKYMTRH